MKTKLTSTTYWRLEGQDIIVANESTILRLNTVSADAFKELLEVDDAERSCSQTDVDELKEQLITQAMLEECENTFDPWAQHSYHISRSA